MQILLRQGDVAARKFDSLNNLISLNFLNGLKCLKCKHEFRRAQDAGGVVVPSGQRGVYVSMHDREKKL